MSDVPDTVTETIRADELTDGRVVLVYGNHETVIRTRILTDYVDVWTDKTGPDSHYQWPLAESIEAVRVGAPGATE